MTVEVKGDISVVVDLETTIVFEIILAFGETFVVEAFVGVCLDVAVEGDGVGRARLKGLRPCFGDRVETLDVLAAHCVSPLLLFSSITLL